MEIGECVARDRTGRARQRGGEAADPHRQQRQQTERDCRAGKEHRRQFRAAGGQQRQRDDRDETAGHDGQCLAIAGER